MMADSAFSSEPRIVDRASLALWSDLLGDPNPIHLDPEYVRQRGWGHDAILHGPAQIAYVISAMEPLFPDHRVGRLSVRFLANIYAEERAEVIARVSDRQPSAEGMIEIDATLHVTGRDVLSCAVSLKPRTPGERTGG